MDRFPASLPPRDRALLELASARGWINEAELERAAAAAATAGAERALRENCGLTAQQWRSLEEAVSGAATDATLRAPSSSRPGTSTGAEVTISGASSSAQPRSMPSAIGTYRILRELGRGGAGVVYRALDPALHRDVALKVLLAGDSAGDDAVERFRREAALLARVGAHAHLVQVHDVGRDGERLFFTMDYIEGRSLAQRIADEGALPPREAATLAADIAGALGAAHAAGVVHRDVKPQNILLDAKGHPYLSDFGLARDASSAARGLTASGDLFGTPAYMPPEQASGRARQAGPAADVWSLGATLYEMLAGSPPFGVGPLPQVVRAVLDRDPSPIAWLKPGVHPDLETICFKCLQKDPAKRYATGAELEAELRRWLAGEPIIARPAGTLERLAGKLRRHRGAAVAVALALVAAVAGTAIPAWRAARQAGEAQKVDDARLAREANALPLMKEGDEALARGLAAENDADMAARAREYQRAADKFAAASEANPDDVEAVYRMGFALFRLGRAEEAIKALTEALRMNSRHSLALYYRGRARQALLQSAMGYRQQMVFSSGATQTGFRASGFRSMMIVEMPQAATDAEIEALRLAAAEDFRQLLSVDASGERAALGRAFLARLERRFDDALRELDQILQTDPGFKDARLERGTVLAEKTLDPAVLIPDLEILVRQEPKNLDYGIALAECLVASGRGAEGTELARNLAERHPGDADAACRCARTLSTAGMADAALEILGSVPLDNLSTAWRNEVKRTQCQVLANGGRKKEALELIEVTRREAGSGFATVLRAELFAETGRYLEARDAMRQIDRTWGYFGVTAIKAAGNEIHCGNLDMAIEYLDVAERTVSHPTSRLTRAIVSFNQGDFDHALAEFRAIAAERPDMNVAYGNIAGCLFLQDAYGDGFDVIATTLQKSQVTENQKKALQQVLDGFGKRVRNARTPAEAGKVLEELAGAMLFARAQLPAGSSDGAMLSESVRAVYQVLQEHYFRHGLFKESAAMGDRALAIERTPATLYRTARALAGAGKEKRALERLKEAIDEGLDSGSRLDGEKAFDALRQSPGFQELRKKCRP